MAPNVTSSNREMPKVWYNGHYLPAKQEGSKFYIEEVNGVKKEVDKNDLFGMNSWEKLNKSFNEQIGKHNNWINHWQDLQKKASESYKNAVATFKKFSEKYYKITQGRNLNELKGTEKNEAQEYYANMTSASASKRRAVSNTIFYGYMAAAEASYKLGISNLQGIAKIMAQR